MFGVLVYIGLLAALTYFSLRQPYFALVAILCMFGLEQWGSLYIPFLRENGSFTNIYILLLVGYASFIAFKRGFFSVTYHPDAARVRAMAVLLFAYALFTLLWVNEEANAASRWIVAGPYLIASILLAPLLIGRIEQLERVQKLFVLAAGILVLLLAIVPDWDMRRMRVAGSQDSVGFPLTIGQFAGYLLITAVMHIDRRLLTIASALLVAGLSLLVTLLSQSRGPFLFSIVCVVLVLPIASRNFSIRQFAYLLGITLLLSGLAVLLFSQADILGDRWALDKMLSDMLYRLSLVEILLAEWLDTPPAWLFGLGSSASFGIPDMEVYPHFVPGEVLGELGLIGFCIYLAALGYSVRMALNFRRLEYLPVNVRRVYAANFGCFLFTFMLSLKQGSLISLPELFLFATLGEKYFFLAQRESRRNQRLAGLKLALQEKGVFRPAR